MSRPTDQLSLKQASVIGMEDQESKEALDVQDNKGLIQSQAMRLKIEQINALILKLPKGRNNTLLLVVDCLDGLGDFIHFKEFAKYIKTHYPALKLAGIIGLGLANRSLCEAAIDFIESNRAMFTDLYIFNNRTAEYQNESYANMESSYKHKTLQKLIIPFPEFDTTYSTSEVLDKLNDEVAIIFQISVVNLSFGGNEPNAIDLWLEKKQRMLPYSIFGEYGSTETKDCMGLGEENSGIRLMDEWQGEVTQEKRIQALLSIDSNLEFLEALLMKKAPTAKDAEQYYTTRKFFPGYLQKEMPLTFFIALTCCAHNNHTGLDFYVPEQYINIKVFAELFQKIGIKDSDWRIINPGSAIEPATRIRIFTNRFRLNDIDYKKLYYAASGIAGCSGDDSFSTVFSSGNLPVLLCRHPKKTQLLRQMIEELDSLSCGTYAKFLKLFLEDLTIKFTTHCAKAMLAFHLWYYKGDFCDDPNELYAPDVNYLEAQKMILITYAKTIGEFILKNSHALEQELNTYRKHVYHSRNVFSHLSLFLENDLQMILEKEDLDPPRPFGEGLFKPGFLLTSVASSSAAASPSSTQNPSKDIESLILKLAKMLPPENDLDKWKYSNQQDKLWLQITDKEKYSQLLEKSHLQKAATFTKVQNKATYCLMISPKSLLEVIQPAEMAKKSCLST